MPTVIDDITIANWALAVFGGGSITAFDEGTPLADTCRAIVPRLMDRCLISQEWRMNKATRQLERIAFGPSDPQPPNGYRHGYAFPGDALRGPFRLSLHRDTRSPPFRDWTSEGRRVFCDAEQVFGTFLLRLSPDQWGPSFLDFVITACAAELVIPVSEDKDERDRLYAKAWGSPREGGRGGLAGKVLDEHVANDPGFDPSGDDGPLVEAVVSGQPSFTSF